MRLRNRTNRMVDRSMTAQPQPIDGENGARLEAPGRPPGFPQDRGRARIRPKPRPFGTGLVHNRPFSRNVRGRPFDPGPPTRFAPSALPRMPVGRPTEPGAFERNSWTDPSPIHAAWRGVDGTISWRPRNEDDLGRCRNLAGSFPSPFPHQARVFEGLSHVRWRHWWAGARTLLSTEGAIATVS